ncbi:MAG TPA: iron ABC transporter permease [Thermoplasmata archaeon]|nr:iron ABC transporter permease [Thermoplasmata archaeon]
MEERAPPAVGEATPSGAMRLRRSSPWALLGAIVAIVAVAVALSSLLGTVFIPPLTTLRLLFGLPNACAGTSVSPDLCTRWGEIIWQARLPEIVLAVIAGAALGISGATLQGTFRNPLADPFLLGISSGGTIGAAIVFDFHVGQVAPDLFLPLFAFIGAIATGVAILAVAVSRYGTVETLLLTGVALASLLSAVLALLLLYNPSGSQQVSYWLLGSLGNASWPVDGIALGVLLITGTLLSLFGRELNLMQLGGDVARSAGVDVRRVRIRLILLASLTTGVAVAFTGIIGFVGLVSPHVVRRIAGTDYRYVLPGSALVGAVFLLGARDFALLVYPTSLLPIGIFTAFFGAPFFIYLLFRRRVGSPMGSL